MAEGRLGIHVNIDLEKNTAVEKRLRTQLKQLEKMASLKMKIDTSGITKSFANVGRAVQKNSVGKYISNDLQGAIKQTQRMADGMTNLTTHTEKFGGAIYHAIEKYTLWFTIGTAIKALVTSFKNGVETVKELEKSLATMNITMDGTASKFEGMKDSAIEFATEMNTSIQKTIDAMEIFTNMNETAQTILERAKPTVLLSDLTGNDIGETADALQGLAFQFGHTSDETEYLASVLTTLGADTALEFSRAINVVNSSVQRGGYVASQAGLSLEEYTSIVATVAERSRQSGSIIASGLSTTFSRMSRVSELGAEEMSKIEGAYAEIGVQIRDAEDNIRPMGRILEDLSKKWKHMSNVEQSYISEMSAGVRQRRTFLAMMENYEVVLERVQKAENSAGFLEERHEIWESSLEGQLQSLRTEMDKVWISFLDTGALKDLVNYGETVVKTINQVFKVISKISGLLGGFDTVIPAGLAILFSKQAVSIAMRIHGTLKLIGHEYTNMNKNMDGFKRLRKYLSKEELTSLNDILGTTKRLQNEEEQLTNLQRKGRADKEQVLLLESKIQTIRRQANGVYLKTEYQKMQGYMREKQALNDKIKSLNDVEKDLIDNRKRQEELNKATYEYAKASRQRQFISTMVKGTMMIVEGIRTFVNATEEGISNMEKMSRISSGVGFALMMSGNPYAMIAGGALQVASAIFQKFDKSVEEVSESLEELASSLETLGDSRKVLNSVGEEYEELRKRVFKVGKISNLLPEEQERLYEIMNKISDVMPSVRIDIDEQGNSIIDLTRTYKDLIEVLNELFKTQNSEYKSQTSTALEEEERQAKLRLKTLKELYDFLEENEPKFNDDVVSSNLRYYTDILTKGDKSDVEVADIMNELIKANEAGETYVDMLARLNIEVEQATDLLGFFNTGVMDSGEFFEKYADKIELSAFTISRMLKEAREAFGEFTDEVADLQGYIDTLELGSISADDATDLIEQYPHLISLMENEADLQKEIIRLQNVAKEAQLEKFKKMLETSDLYYTEQIRAEGKFMKRIFETYGVNLTDFTNLAQAKMNVDNKLRDELHRKWGIFYDVEARKMTLLGYLADKAGFGFIDNMKADIKVMEDTYAQFIKDINSESLDETSLESFYSDSSLDGSTSANKMLSSYIDYFLDLNDVIKKITSSIDKINLLMGKLPEGDTNRISLLKEENKLLAQKQILLDETQSRYETVASDNKEMLLTFGVDFNGDDVDYEKYNNIVESYVAKVNNSRDEARTSAENQLKTLTEAFKNYYQMQASSLPEIKKEWLEVAGAITENRIAIENVKLDDLDSQLDYIEQMIDGLGELDSFEKLSERTKLFGTQQGLLKSKLDLVDESIQKYTSELENMSLETEEGAYKASILIGYLDELQGYKADIEINIEENITEEQDRVLDLMKDVEDEIIDLIKNRIDEEQEIKEEAHEDEIERLDKERGKWEEYYDARLQALKDEKSEIDHNEKMNDLLEDRTALQDELNELALDNSVEARKREREVLEEFKDNEREIEQETRDYTFSQAEQLIENEMNLKLDAIDKEIEAENNAHELAMDDLEEAKTQSALYAEAHKIMLENTYTQLTKMINDEQMKWGDGLSYVGDAIENNIITKLESAKLLMDQMGFNGDEPIGQKINEAISENFNVDSGYDLGGVSVTNLANAMATSIEAVLSSKLIDYSNGFGEVVNYNNSNNSINIGKVIEVQGNIDREVVPDLEKIINTTFKKLEDALHADGIYVTLD